jgi:hypothetical protein
MFSINVSFVGARQDNLEVVEGDVLPVLRTHYSIIYAPGNFIKI